jgi:hypothetical protein
LHSIPRFTYPHIYSIEDKSGLLLISLRQSPCGVAVDAYVDCALEHAPVKTQGVPEVVILTWKELEENKGFARAEVGVRTSRH